MESGVSALQHPTAANPERPRCPRFLFLLFGLLIFSLLAAMGYAFALGYRMVAIYVPLVDASMEIKTEITTSHLWFEEVIDGDAEGNVAAAWQALGAAEWYAAAMLNGGSNPEGTFHPIANRELRRDLGQVNALFGSFRRIAEQRLAEPQLSGSGSALDQQHDAVFTELVRRVDGVETRLQRIIIADLRVFRRIETLLLIGCFLLGAAMFLAYWRFDRQRQGYIDEIRAARSKAEERARWLQVTMESMGDAVITADVEGRITYLNHVAESLTGWTRQEASGQPAAEVFRIINEESREPVEDPVAKVLRNRQVVGLANHALLIDRYGREYPIADSGAPIADNETLFGVVVVFQDITERRRMELALATSETRFRELFNNMASGVAVYEAVDDGADFVIVDFNPAAARIEGVVRDDLLGQRLTEVFPGVVEFGLLEVLARVWRSGEPEEFPLSFYLDDSRAGWRRNFVCKLPSGEVVAIYRDETERVRREEELQRFAHIFNHAQWGVVTAREEDGVLTMVNPAYAAMHGYAVEELVGRPVIELYPEECRSILAAQVEKARRQGQATFETFHLRKDGSAFPVLVDLTAVKDDLGKSHYRVAYTQDISERKRLEEQLLQAQKMEAIGRLSGGVAHDFNNMLTTIIGYSEMALMEVPPGGPLAEQLEAIHYAGERAAGLTRQLLAFSRKQVLEMQPIDLNEVVDTMSKMLRRLIGEDVRLHLHTQDGLGAVMADRGQVEQILMNLAVNARDAMPDGGFMTIETADVELDEEYAARHEDLSPGNYVMLTVTDTGEGMSKQVQERLFEPFFTTKEYGKGTGLGLATVYGIVKQHRGHIYVYSEPGSGTIFKIYFPVAGAGPAVEAPRRRKVMPRGSERIMVVDDEASIRRLIYDTLQPLGYEIVEAASGEEALDLCEKGLAPVDLLLTDVVMPGMNGSDLAENVSRRWPGVKVVYMSGYTDNVIAYQGVLRPDISFLSKPLVPSVLAVRLREVLDGSKPAMA